MPASSPVPMDRLREQWGFVPNLFQSHPLPERLEIAVRLIDAILFQDSKLPRLRKELLLLTLAAATGNSYWAGIHLQILLLMGMPEDTAIAAVRDFRSAPLDNEVRVLIRFAIEAAVLGQYEAREAHAAGLADDALQDTVALAGLSIYLNALTAPAKPEPDFGPWTQPVVPVTELFAAEGSPDSIEPVIERMFAGRPDLRGHLWRPEDIALVREPVADADFPHPSPAEPSQPAWEPDPDAALIAAARQGDTGAFEELVHKHGRRVYRTLAGILGDHEDAQDAMQDTFLKAFRRLNTFEGRSRFSTWLVSIGANAALEKLRERRPVDSLDEGRVDDEGTFRPRLLQSWCDSPEQRYVKLQMKELVQREVRRLPVTYRAVVVLRDIEELSTREAAEALGLEVPTLKSRLLRGRLLLREALSPHFAASSKGALS